MIWYDITISPVPVIWSAWTCVFRTNWRLRPSWRTRPTSLSAWVQSHFISQRTNWWWSWLDLLNDRVNQDCLSCHHIRQQVSVRWRLLVKELTEESSGGHDDRRLVGEGLSWNEAGKLLCWRLCTAEWPAERCARVYTPTDGGHKSPSQARQTGLSSTRSHSGFPILQCWFRVKYANYKIQLTLS